MAAAARAAEGRVRRVGGMGAWERGSVGESYGYSHDKRGLGWSNLLDRYAQYYDGHLQ